MSLEKPQSRFRKYFWPIYAGENKKFFLMMSIFFLISFNYNILRAAKDALVVTAPFSGAEAIPFIKVWAMLPMAFLLTFLFTRLSNKFDSAKVFNIMLSIFIGFFIVFTLVLYPLRDTLHPNAFIDKISPMLPAGFKGLLAIVRNWTLTSFYVMSELWGTVVLSVLFFGFANNISPVDEAKRFYPLFGVGANISGALSGQAAMYLSSNTFNSWISYGTTAWEQSVLFMNGTVIVIGCLIMLIFRYINKSMAPQMQFIRAQKDTPQPKLSMRKTFAYLGKSKYLLCIALIVLTYNITINLTEVLWKNQIRELYPNPSDYSSYMGKVMTAIGILATVIALFISGNMLRKFRWTVTAMLAPVTVLITGLFFFSSFLVSHNALSMCAAFFCTTPLMMNVFFGSLQNVMARASKYTVFDATKEIAFIPLSQESKIKGKAAIDGVGSRIGKSGGAVIYQGLLIFCTTLSAAAPYVAVIFLVVVAIWIIAVHSLGRQFHALAEEKEALSIEESTASKEKSPVGVP